ncbi:MAG: ATP-binding protein, partial [Treponema sp.]|nr:ATP-binding protein [Treponema sp.]
NIRHLQHYINVISDYASSEESGLSNVNGLYGYFETIEGGPVHLFSENINWVQPENFSVFDQSWYRDAITYCGNIVETMPYIDYMTGEYIISYSICIHDKDDIRIGVVSIDVPMDKIGEIVVNAAVSDGGYGAIAAQDLTMFAHANPSYVGRRMDDPGLRISMFKDFFYNGMEVYERPMKNWKGEDVIVFTRLLDNGWHLMLLSPKKMFYAGTNQMLIVLLVLGAILSTALILVLIRIDKAREKAGEESRQKSAFLANMSHEIRTPMNAIIGMTFIGKSAGDIPRKDYCLEKIESASQHLLGVINDVLDMSKIEANMFKLSHEEYNFEKTLMRVVNIISFRTDEKKQEMSVYIDESIPRVLIGDDQRLAQVITNLLSNAIKFTPEGGSITLDARLIGEENGLYTIKITVKDSGIGINPEQHKLIFHAFQQADSKTSRKFGGTGLGLSISKNIVELMGSSLEIESEPGKGSSFFFNITEKRGTSNNETDTIVEKKINYDGIFKGYKILLAEDVEINREIIETLVAPTLLEVDFAHNGLEAVDMFKKYPDYDLILMDVQMPEMDGYDATRKIRVLENQLTNTNAAGSVKDETQTHIRKQIPIIAMTANVFREDIEKCIESGMNGHIGKPIDVIEFLTVLQKYLVK